MVMIFFVLNTVLCATLWYIRCILVVQCSLVVYTMEYPTSHLYFLGIHESLGECVYQENTSDSWDIPWYTTRERCIAILHRAIENKGQHN